MLWFPVLKRVNPTSTKYAYSKRKKFKIYLFYFERLIKLIKLIKVIMWML